MCSRSKRHGSDDRRRRRSSRRHGDRFYDRRDTARLLDRRNRRGPRHRLWRWRDRHNRFERSFIFATYGRWRDWLGLRRGKQGRSNRRDRSAHRGFLHIILACRRLGTRLRNRLRTNSRINRNRLCDDRSRFNRTRFDYRRLDRTHLGTRLLGRRRRFSRLYRRQTKQGRIDAQRHRRLSLRIKGVRAGENTGKTVANKQRNRFAPRRKNHPKLSVN